MANSPSTVVRRAVYVVVFVGAAVPLSQTTYLRAIWEVAFRHSLTATAPVSEDDVLQLVRMASLSQGDWMDSSTAQCRLSDTGVWTGWLQNPDWQRSFEIRVENLSGRLVLRDLW